MGKKGKKAAKEQQAERERAAAARDLEARVAAARRERAAKIRDLEARVAALAERLDAELKGVDVFSPLEERDDCPLCMTTLPLDIKEVDFMPCCGKVVCSACSRLEGIQALKKMAKFDDTAAVRKILDDSPCAFCRSATGESVVEKYKKLAENRSDTKAMMLLGKAYFKGDQVPKDELAALGWYVRAAETGYPMALSKVADMCYFGSVLEENVNHAVRLAIAGAKKGCVVAHDLLAVIYMRDFMADPLGARQTKFFDHWKFAAAAGCRVSMKILEDDLTVLQNSKMENTRQSRILLKKIAATMINSAARMYLSRIAYLPVRDAHREQQEEEQSFWTAATPSSALDEGHYAQHAQKQRPLTLAEKLVELGTPGMKALHDDREGMAFAEKFEELDARWIFTQDIVDGVKEEFEKAAKLEFSKERKEYRKDQFDERIKKMIEEKFQIAQTAERANGRRW